MKLADIGGFAAILFAGYYVGVHSASIVTGPMDFASTATVIDWVIVIGLLALGFYLAVVLS